MPIHGSTLKVGLAVVTKQEHLAVILPTHERYVQQYPVERAPGASMTFQGRPALLLDNDEWIVYCVTTGGRLVRCKQRGDEWSTYIPTEQPDLPDLPLAGSAVVLAGRTASEHEVFGVTTDNRLVRLLIDGDRCSIDYPAEKAVSADFHGLRFAGSPAAMDFDAPAGKRLVYAITTDGVLVELWGDGDRWEAGYPADEAGEGELRFRGSPNARLSGAGTADVTKRVTAFTRDDRLITFTGKYDNRAATQFGDELRFPGDRAAMVNGPPEYAGVIQAAVTSDGHLICFDSAGGVVKPAEAAELGQTTFRRNVRVTFEEGRVFVHAVTYDDEKVVQFRSDPVGDPPVFALPHNWSHLMMGDWSGGGDIGR